FRTTIPLPGEVPIGDYNVDIKLLSGGAFVTSTTTMFEVVKVGFEQFVASAAQQHALLYGLTIVAMALLTGWLASVVFRRD
ncbi:MAG: TIGR02186 family protein, partial [Xanthobacteraceae bacterium]